MKGVLSLFLILLVLLPLAWAHGAGSCITTLPPRQFPDGGKVAGGSCGYTSCDIPSIRDQHLLKESDPLYTVNINAVYFGVASAQDLVVYDQQLEYFRTVYTAVARINFTIATTFVTSGPYLSTPSTDQTTHQAMAQAYYQPNHITLMFTSFSDNTGEPGSSITLGYATLPQLFPSNPAKFYMILDRNYAITPTGNTILHEMGHLLGLLHTFTDSCDGCSETVNSADLDLVGDMCSDTLPHSVSFDCDTLSSNTDCDGTPYGAINTLPQDNYMAYTPDSCQDKFTAQQIGRMRCYLTQETPQFIDNYNPPVAAPSSSPSRSPAGGVVSAAQKQEVLIGGVVVALATLFL